MIRGTLLRYGFAVALGIVLLPAAPGKDPDITLKGHVVVGQHRKQLEAGKLYLIKVDGEGFQPVVRISPGNFILYKTSEGSFAGYVHPRETREYRVLLSTYPQDEAGDGLLDYTLTIKHVPLAQQPVLTEKARLTDTDPLNKAGSGLPQNCRVKAFELKLTAKKVYLIEMVRVSGKLDPMVALEGPDGNLAAMSSEGKPNVDSRLYFEPRRTGTYRVLATTYAPGTGEFTVRVLSEGAPGTEAASAVIAETGFNDGAGINSNATPDSPYPLEARGKQGGAGEPGWAGPWEPASPQAVFQKKVVFEGDGALYLTNTGVTRRLSEPQQGRFLVEQYVQIPKDGGVQSYISNPGGFRSDGAVWTVFKGKFLAFDGDGKGSGKFLETPFASEPGKWHKVTLTIDVPAQRWEFSVDDRKFEPPQPLRFRSTEDRLSSIRYQCENVPGAYIDAVRFLRVPAAPAKK